MRDVLLGLLFVAMAASSPSPDRKCLKTSPVKEWFPPYNSSHGLLDFTENPPGWAACQVYSRATCCEKNHTDVVAKISLLMLRSHFSPLCISLTESTLCSLACSPDIGLGLEEPTVCAGTCSAWYHACALEFVSPPEQSIHRFPFTPCVEEALVCSQLRDLHVNALDFCAAMSVREDDTKPCAQVDFQRRGQPAPRFVAFSSSRSHHHEGMWRQFYADMHVVYNLFVTLAQRYTVWVDSLLVLFFQQSMGNVNSEHQWKLVLACGLGCAVLVWGAFSRWRRRMMMRGRVADEDDQGDDDFEDK